jgi:hypothetical protein
MSSALLAGAFPPMLHPQPSHPHVAVPVALVALGAAMVVVVVASAVPSRSPDTVAREAATASWAGRLSTPQAAVRALSVLVLVIAVLAGRLGARDELENVAPALVIGAGWPLLVAGSLVVGSLWRWLDPWDALARVAARGDTSAAPGHVWTAVGLAVPWLWLLGASDRPLDPRAVGTALGVYSVVTVAGCVALGRARWLSSSEPIGLLLSWVGLVPRRQLTSWSPPRGAAALLGTVIGGLLFGAVRRTGVWTPVAQRDDAWLIAGGSLVAACLLAAAAALLATRAGRTEAQRAAVAQVLVPVAAGAVIAVALARNRLFTSVQLLPGLIGDPLGRGWDLLGSPTAGLHPSPLGAAGLVAAQLCVIGVLHLFAAIAGTRPLVGDERLPVIAVLAVSVAVSMTAIGLH